MHKLYLLLFFSSTLVACQSIAATADRARGLIKAAGPLAEPHFTNRRMLGFQNPGGKVAMAALADAPTDLSAQRHWLEAQYASAVPDQANTHAKAIASYDAAAAASTGPDADRQRLAAQIAAAALIWSTDPAAAATRLNAISTTRPEALAAMAQLRGRMALSAGDQESALAQFGIALSAAARSLDPNSTGIMPEITADIAMAHALAGRIDLAAAQMAFSADNHIVGAIAANIVPACIPALGLTRETAVIMRVERRGTETIAVEPVWTRGPISVTALGHLRAAAAHLRWQADDVTASPATRLFLSCAAGVAGISIVNSQVDLEGPLPLLMDWLRSKKIDAEALLPMPAALGAKPFDQLPAAISAMESSQGYDAPALVLLYVLAATGPSTEGRAILLDRAIGIAERNQVSPKLAAALASMRWQELADRADVPAATAGLTAALAAFPQNEIGSPHWLATAMFLLRLHQAASSSGNAADAAGPNAQFQALAARILALPAANLPADDDLRRYINALLAEDALRRQDKPALFRHMTNAGMLAESCELADEPGPVRGMSITEDDFPLAVRKANIPGMVRIQRRAGPDGSTAAARVIIARPPVLYDAPSLAAMAPGVQPPPRRAGKPFACDNNQQPIRWSLTD